MIKIKNLYLVYYSGDAVGGARGVGLMYGTDIKKLSKNKYDPTIKSQADKLADEINRKIS